MAGALVFASFRHQAGALAEDIQGQLGAAPPTGWLCGAVAHGIQVFGKSCLPNSFPCVDRHQQMDARPVQGRSHPGKTFLPVGTRDGLAHIPPEAGRRQIAHIFVGSAMVGALCIFTRGDEPHGRKGIPPIWEKEFLLLPIPTRHDRKK